MAARKSTKKARATTKAGARRAAAPKRAAPGRKAANPAKAAKAGTARRAKPARSSKAAKATKPSKSTRAAKPKVAKVARPARGAVRKASAKAQRAARPAKAAPKRTSKAAGTGGAKPGSPRVTNGTASQPPAGLVRSTPPTPKGAVRFERLATDGVPPAGRALRIALFGGTGRIGSRIAKEALSRGHHVTAVSRHATGLDLQHPELRLVRADAGDAIQVAAVARGHDAVVSAVGAPMADPSELRTDTRAIVRGARDAGVRRVLVVNGAGSLEVAPGKQLMDTPQFPADWRPVAAAHRDVLEDLRKSDVDWTAVSPAAMIEPGKRTGKFQVGGDALIADKKGESRISMEDYAVAVVDELERGQNIRKRMTVGYS